jgi:tetratricopeptide (TPR) repeat protein
MESIKLDPRNADPYINLGTILQEKGQMNDAIKYYEKALELKPKNAVVHYNLGSAYHKTGQLEKAITFYERTIQLNPSPSAYNNLGSALLEKGQIDEGIICYKKALQIDPNYANAYCNMGVAFREKRQIDEVIISFYKTIRLNPNHADAYSNLGSILSNKRQLDESIKNYQAALRLNPNHAEAHYGLSLVLLSLGNFIEGLKEHEWRWKSKDFICQYRNFSQPFLDISVIEGRTIFLYAEQGLGDNIQFIRYAPLIAQRGGNVILECSKELKSLLQNITSISKVITYGEQLPEFDMYCPLLSLPFVFNTRVETIPAKIPYITADTELVRKWGKKLHDDNSLFKIGLVWAGNPKHKNNYDRSCSLEVFRPLTQCENISFYSLQKGEAGKQAKNSFEGMNFIDYMDEVHDFADTAALIENLDLIVSVDTAVAHLAGALGKQVWTLLPFAPDWRWMLNREDSPWYPTMRLFRQPSPGDWKSVIDKIKDELCKTDGILKD